MYSPKSKAPLVVLGILSMMFVVVPAHAVVMPVTSRAALGGTDSMDWGALGPEGTAPTNPFMTTSMGGVGLDVSKPPGGSFSRLDQSSGWTGNFSPGDALLYNGASFDGVPGPVTIVFDTPVMGAGANIQENFFGAFTATLEAFDSADMSLGMFSFPGFSSPDGDGSAIFAGVLSDAFDIKKIVFDTPVASFGPSDFAINKLDLVTTEAPTVVPEPGTILLFGIGLALLPIMKMRRRAATVKKV